jgi:hypothetical protein
MNAMTPSSTVEAATEVARANALALLAAAADPEGCKVRIGELTEATAKHDEAKSAAERMLADAEASKVEADRKAADVARREQEFISWKATEMARLKQADADARKGEADNRARAAELDRKSSELEDASGQHFIAMERLRQFLSEHDSAAAKRA